MNITVILLNSFPRVQMTVSQHWFRDMAWCQTGDKPVFDPMLAKILMPYGIIKLYVKIKILEFLGYIHDPSNINGRGREGFFCFW